MRFSLPNRMAWIELQNHKKATSSRSPNAPTQRSADPGEHQELSLYLSDFLSEAQSPNAPRSPCFWASR